MLSAHRSRRVVALVPLLALLFALAPQPTAQAAEPTTITIAGNFQEELGCGSDWKPDCATTHLTKIGNGVWRGVFTIPMGSWEYKAVINDDWGNGSYAGNHQANGNTTLNLANASGSTQIRFFYDDKTKAVLDSVMDKVAVAAGSFQSELGCQIDWSPDCVRTLLTDVDGDGKYTFTTTEIPPGNYEFKVALNENWTTSFPGSNAALTVTSAGEKVVINWNSVTNEVTLGEQLGDLNKTKAHWLDRDTLAWNIAPAPNTIRLIAAANGGLVLAPTGVTGGESITLNLDPAGLSAELKAKYPHLASYKAYTIAQADLAKVPGFLKGQLAVEAVDGSAKLIDATGVQIPGVLDDLYTYNGALGVSYAGAVPSLRLWAPTAKSVKLHVFDNATTSVSSTVAMAADTATGVWSATGDAGWTNKYYWYEVEVYAPAAKAVVKNLVTDPYSLNLSINSGRSQIVNLNDPALKPAGWNGDGKPKLAAPEDIVLYELHVRDFSATDATVPQVERGTFKAFTEQNSNGMKHLKALQQAGLTHIHLLPAFDCASINEDKSTWKAPAGDLAALPPDSEQQQALIEPIRDQDGFNWCYDPFHYTVPEGSYSTNPNDTTRILEFRQMVQALNRAGLRVVMDVVYNHTASSGQNEKSVLDKIVPGYYHRLNLEGGIERSTCCENTASEHAMMEKLMVDSLVTWARDYKVDGFRFDLMGHHSLANMTKIRDTLQGLTPQQDGVDGKAIYIYGEGWNFGEVANDARFKQATQLNLAGSGLGSFNDRLRDAARGGGPFSGLQEQGFATGLFTKPNGVTSGTPDEQKARLLLNQDQIRASLAGSLKGFSFIDRTGATKTGGQIDYNGSPAGYTADPQEIINYVEAHDNETLFDAVQVKAAATDTITDRIRMVYTASDLVLLAQGVPFLQAGQDILRSKSFDRNSYNSGDWFNRIDWTYGTNGFGSGLPPKGDNQSNWPLFKPLLANGALKPTTAQIKASAEHFRDMIKIRKSSPLFRLRTAAEVQQQLSFLNTGPNQTPGVVVMRLTDPRKLHIDNPFGQIVVVFNASAETKQLSYDVLKGAKLRLHPVQQSSKDTIVRASSFDSVSGTLSVPARTTAVFVQGDYQSAAALVQLKR